MSECSEPTEASYGRHRYRGEKPCRPCTEAHTLACRNRQGDRWRVYVVKFIDGMWYYGSAKALVTTRMSRHRTNPRGRMGEYILSGMEHTVEVLALCDTQDQARQMEARLILASDRTRLLNDVLPWHFCDGSSNGYRFHQARGEPPCEFSVRRKDNSGYSAGW